MYMSLFPSGATFIECPTLGNDLTVSADHDILVAMEYLEEDESVGEFTRRPSLSREECPAPPSPPLSVSNGMILGKFGGKDPL
jgi:hypothetical protein